MSESNLIKLGCKKHVITFVLGCLIAPLRLLAWISSQKGVQKRFLILEPFGLGDVISLEPMVRALGRKGEVTICGKSSWQALYPQINWIEVALPWSSYDPGQKYGLRRYFSGTFLGFIRKLRGQSKGSIGIDTRGDIRSVLLLYLVGCRKVLTLSHYLGSDLKNPTWVGEVVPFRHGLRRWESNLQFVGLLQPVELSSPGPRFEHLVQTPSGSRNGKVIGFVPIAPWEGKLWSADAWKELAERLRQEGWEVRILCGPGQSQFAAHESGVTNATPIECNSIQDWADQLSRLTILVSLDSGPMHLADALGVPVVALFGQGILPLWAPTGVKSRALHHQGDSDFRQCHPIPENAAMARRFMKRITLQEVLASIREVTGP